jgi:TIR domain
MYTGVMEKYKYGEYEHKGEATRMATKPKRPLNVYLSYTQKDEAFKQEFEDYLTILQQNGLISGWVERQVQPGIDWSQVIDSHLLTADLVLLLVSPGFLASGYCSGAEVREAFKRSKKGEACVIPIILHYADLKGYLLETVQSTNAIPISSWPDRNEAWRNIDQELRDVIKDMTKQY